MPNLLSDTPSTPPCKVRTKGVFWSVDRAYRLERRPPALKMHPNSSGYSCTWERSETTAIKALAFGPVKHLATVLFLGGGDETHVIPRPCANLVLGQLTKLSAKFARRATTKLAAETAYIPLAEDMGKRIRTV